MSDLFSDISPADFMIKHAGNECLNLVWSADGKPSIAGIFTRYYDARQGGVCRVVLRTARS